MEKEHNDNLPDGRTSVSTPPSQSGAASDRSNANGGKSSVEITVHNLSAQINTVQNMPVHNNAWHVEPPHAAGAPVSSELKRTGLEDLLSVKKVNLPAKTPHSAAGTTAEQPQRPATTCLEYTEKGTVRGGYASVKGKVRHSTKLLWIVLIVMTLLCIGASVAASLATAYFMRKGAEPVQIVSENTHQQSVSAVVTARSSCVAEISCGGLSGSGIIMKLHNGKVYVLTNAHVINWYIQSGSTPGVRFYKEDDYYEAEVVGYSRFYDVAVLSVVHKTLYDTYDLDGSEYFKQDLTYNAGDYVVAIGNGMGRGIAAYDGIISRTSELLRYNDKTVPVLRTTAAINSGMSGGALFDLEGHIVGMNTYRMSSTGGSEAGHDDDVEDTGFVMPVSVVYPVYKQILEYGTGDEIGLINMNFYKTNSSSVGAIVLTDLGFTCEVHEGKLTVTALDANTAPSGVHVGDVIEAIGSFTPDDDLCRICGEILRYRRGASGTPLRFTVSRGNSVAEFSGYGLYVR
ncbi:MAG: trypsin-like peptidase domain-containing protein [Roseburia sp.]|nr:trypsin-like peptidase domain-containing protein [Roseburia sp.]